LRKIFTERKGGGSGQRVGSPVPAIFWRGDEEKRKKKPRPNRYRRQGANLKVGALQCPKGTNRCGVLHAYMERFPLLAESLGRHYP
jgi:hypothetical protein